MNYQMHFDPYLIEHLNQRHEELLQQMEALRLEKRLRKHHEGSGLRLVAYFLRLERVRSIRFAGRVPQGGSSA